MFITAELAVEDELIEALPATTWPLVGNAIFGKGKIVLVCAKADEHPNAIIIAMMRTHNFCQADKEFGSKKCIFGTILLQIFWKYENRFEFDC